jgi:murein DD-endopeptidase MepM/ murein hydrolase activator NlpD
VLALLVAFAVVATAPAPAAPRPAPTHLDWPAEGTITTPFVAGGHPGLDIGMLRSTTVRAAAPGRVKLVGAQPGYEGYGNVVLVDVGGGYSTLYAHLAEYRVRAGDEVEEGETIATAGCTGLCTGTHLHFELRLSGVAVDPLRMPLRVFRGERNRAQHAGPRAQLRQRDVFGDLVAEGRSLQVAAQKLGHLAVDERQ